MAQFHVDLGGELTPCAPATAAAGSNGASFGMAVDQNGNNLYLVHSSQSGARDVIRLAIQADGAVGASSATLLAGDPAFEILLHPSGKFASVLSPAALRTAGFQFGVAANGELQPLNPAIAPFMANGATRLPAAPPSTDPGGHFLYCGDYGSGLARHVINADGTLSDFVPYAIIPSVTLGRLIFNPAGGFAFAGSGSVTVTSGGSLVQFRVKADVTLAQMGSPAQLTSNGGGTDTPAAFAAFVNRP